MKNLATRIFQRSEIAAVFTTPSETKQGGPAGGTKRSMPVHIKEINADGTFDGLLAVYNNVDLGRDLIEPGAFTKTIQEHGSSVPLLWQHNTHEPIGTLTLVDGVDALHVKGKLLMELPPRKKHIYCSKRASSAACPSATTPSKK